jgi:hypothetical protein
LPIYLGFAIYHSRKKDKYELSRKDYWTVLFLGVMGF